MDSVAPRDKWNLIYVTVLVHGLGTLIAWNMFITAKDYFVKYKLENAPSYSQNYLAYVGWASQIPNLSFSWFNVFIQLRGDLTTRIIWSLIVEIIIFIITIILAMVDSSGWPEVFFWLTMISVFFLNGFNAIFQNSVFGIAAHLPPKYTGAVILGTNICGSLVVLLSWMSKFFHNLRTSAIYYFIGGIFVLVLCLDSFIALPLNRFYRYYKTLLKHSNPSPGTSANTQERIPYRMIFRQTAVQLYNIFIIFFVSLGVFPAVISDVQPVNKGFLGDDFVLITCFLTFNLMAMIGNITASLRQIPGPRLLIVFTTVRLLFIPFFLLCNYQVPGRTLGVLIKSDWLFWLSSMLLGWSSGHGSSLGMMYVSGMVAPEYAAKAGMIGAGMLMTGILSGITFTRLCPILVTL